MSLAAVRTGFSEVVSDVVDHHEHVAITRNGTPVAIIVSISDWEALEDTLYWQTVAPEAPAELNAIRAARVRGEDAGCRPFTLEQLEADRTHYEATGELP